MIVYVLRVAHGERGAVHSFFELLRVSHILSGLEEHCVPCCGGSRNEALAVWVVKQSKRFTLIPLVFELIDSLGRAEGHVNQLV